MGGIDRGLRWACHVNASMPLDGCFLLIDRVSGVEVIRSIARRSLNSQRAMKKKLETIELAAVRIASDAELPRETARNLNTLLQSLVVVLNSQSQEIERLHKLVQELAKK